MTKFTQEEYSKAANGTLSHTEWNKAATNINDLIDAAGNSAGGSSVADTVISVSSKGNTEISSAKHINLEPAYSAEGGSENNEVYGDIQMKPGDDITLESSHRETAKRGEICIKTTNGLSGASKSSVKLQVKASDLTLSTDGKKGEDANVMNVNVTTGSGKGYLKVRAQAIDLRCEQPGGVALQPKGEDSNHYKNKIKFEHGGGDGLEFGTFNPDHTSLYTTDYRFKKDGIIKLSTRTPIARNTTSDTTDPDFDPKYKADDVTTHYYYEKAKDQNDEIIDDFYDNIDANDPTCTWEDIVKFIAWAKANKSGKDWEAIWAD